MIDSGEIFEIILHIDGKFTAIKVKPVSSMENHIACVSATAKKSVLCQEDGPLVY